MKNMNDLAKRVTKAEGGKVSLSIAQVKEVMRVLAEEMVCDTKAFEVYIDYFLKKLDKRGKEIRMCEIRMCPVCSIGFWVKYRTDHPRN